MTDDELLDSIRRKARMMQVTAQVQAAMITEARERGIDEVHIRDAMKVAETSSQRRTRVRQQLKGA